MNAMKQNLILLLLFFLLSCNNTDKNITFKYNKDVFIKSAHYFSSAWPKTFWQEFEKGDVDSELKQIKSDGFNTIVLTVPWRGFETGFNQEETVSDELLYERLEFLINAIIDNEMLFMLRVGFPHDFTPGSQTTILEQCTGIYTEEKMQQHWLKYLKTIKQYIRPYQSASAGILVSWEDWWCPHFVYPHLDEEQRHEIAQKLGYASWLKNKSENIVKVLLQKDEVKYEEVLVPEPADLSYVLYLEFIDELLDKKVLQPTKSIFPNTAMEIRVDKLPVKQGDQYTWISHNLYLNEKNHRGTYWAPFWGAANNGELLTADQALKNFEYFLNVVSDNGKNPNHVIEQFNFYDNTPYFPNNANIEPEQIDDFLSGAAPLLKQHTAGFGVWAYRDYQDNAFFNASFEMGLKGWDVTGDINVLENNLDNKVKMEKGATLSQSFVPSKRFMLVSTYDNLSVCLNANTEASLELIINDEAQKDWSINAGKNCTKIAANQFKENNLISVGFKALNSVLIDELRIFGFTQVLGLYDASGNPSNYITYYRKLNTL